MYLCLLTMFSYYRKWGNIELPLPLLYYMFWASAVQPMSAIFSCRKGSHMFSFILNLMCNQLLDMYNSSPIYDTCDYIACKVLELHALLYWLKISYFRYIDFVDQKFMIFVFIQDLSPLEKINIKNINMIHTKST